MAAARRARSIVNDFSFLIVLFFISAIVSLLTLSLLSSHQLRARPAPLVARLYSALYVWSTFAAAPYVMYHSVSLAPVPRGSRAR